MRHITRKASLTGVELLASPIDPTCKASPTFHIQGMCNTGCGNSSDHVLRTRKQDLPLWGWAVLAMPEIAAPMALIF